ncbi:E3 ubiquitin-protein ligase RNF12-B [Fasciola hepatica]|uniref:E3 ubiquitin-protein ligase RNF12-B n=1 Tax=Fasciola hepatica TaxID=6192 RepID=A0A4E0RBA5_FASHE|nr:E3 ubiquitin-protein ligase RNF12-B [Fasciola hepatica]
MFGEDIFSSFFQTPFFEPPQLVNNVRSVYSNAGETSSRLARRERCSQGPRDLFTEISRAVDQVFSETARSLLSDAGMFPRHFYPDYLREISQVPQNHRGNMGVTLNGEVVERPGGNTRFGRHNSNSLVQMDRNRLQWYDSNTRRSLAPPPPASNRSEPCGRLTAAELSKLPLSTFRIQPGKLTQSTASPEQPPPGSSGTPVCVRNGKDDQTTFSPGSAYLQPVSRLQTLVEIQPLQSSPSRGYPECEVCLSEYRDKDRLRHLPCGHAFHSKCIDIWFSQSSTCPKCRAGVRTGLRRLERNRQRNASISRPPANAPVRAIRQRTNGSSGVINRRTAGTNQSTSQTPIQQANRNQPSRRTANQRSSSLSSVHNTGLDTSLRRTEASNATPNTTDSEHASTVSNPESGNSRPALVPALAEDGDTSQAGVNRTSEISPNTGSTRNVVSNLRPVISGTMDKSAYARRKAAEAAIRRADLARQQQLQLEQ